MSNGMNRVMLVGNVGATPEVRKTDTGTQLMQMRLATTESYLDKQNQRQEKTEWHDVVVWGTRADSLSKVIEKGSTVFVDGALHTSSYEREGQKRYRTEVVARDVRFLGGRQPGVSTGRNGPVPALA
jgi:single-strand DNA-binding protein